MTALVLASIVGRGLASLCRSLASGASADAPLDVTCPDCASHFTLAAAVDAAADAAAAGSTERTRRTRPLASDDAWVAEHTRPCPRPSCRARILKTGGCNAMICGRCRLQFCWACMQEWSMHGTSWFVSKKQ